MLIRTGFLNGCVCRVSPAPFSSMILVVTSVYSWYLYSEFGIMSRHLWGIDIVCVNQTVRAHVKKILICRHNCCGNRPAGIEIIFTPELFLHPNFFYQPIRGYTSNFDPVLKRSPLVWFQIRNIFRRRTILQNSDCIQHQTWGKDQRQRPAIRIAEGNVLLMLLSPVDFFGSLPLN